MKKYKSLKSDFDAIVTSYAQLAVKEIREMIIAMGADPSKQFVLPKRNRGYGFARSIHSISVISEIDPWPRLGCWYEQHDDWKNYCEVTEAVDLVDVHSRVRYAYNAFLKQQKG